MSKLNKQKLDWEIYEKQAELCAALASPVRMAILDLVSEKEMTASELLEVLEIPKSNLSQHLKVLKQAGILKVRNEGLYQHLSLGMPQVKQACSMVRSMLLTQMEQQWESIRQFKNRV